MPPDSSVGFAPADWALLFLTTLFLCAGLAWRPRMQAISEALAKRPVACMILLFLLPILLRLCLLPHHPVPRPNIYDEFSHLLVADTLLHSRLANPPHPMHRFFETFFVLQQPTYSSIYPLGLGLVLALGRLISGIPWAGVLLASGALCSACYWMLRAWVTPGWALLGGILAVIEFGPLCQWTNSYYGGSFTAIGGCLVFGALPRLRQYLGPRDAVLLALGFAINMLTRQFESLLLFLAVSLFLRTGGNSTIWRRAVTPFALTLAPVILLILLQNKAVTHTWTTLPEQLSQYLYGVPTSLTIEPNPTPHLPLTPQQEMDYKAQSLTHGPGIDSLSKFLLRLEYRVRYYRFFFLPPLYLAFIASFFALRDPRLRWVIATLSVFALGTNLFPYLLLHYLAAVTSLFILLSIVGLQQLNRIRLRDLPVGHEILRVVVVLCLAEFVSWYALHLFETPALYPLLRYETWDSINHENPRRRIQVDRQLAGIPGQLLVFVRYSPNHIYQEEWVWNAADIDSSRIVYARDLGPEEDQKLVRYYPSRKALLLEPDFYNPQLSPF
jgi:hypothetical protein